LLIPTSIFKVTLVFVSKEGHFVNSDLRSEDARTLTKAAALTRWDRRGATRKKYLQTFGTFSRFQVPYILGGEFPFAWQCSLSVHGPPDQ
jgi:hypothetical protein